MKNSVDTARRYIGEMPYSRKSDHLTCLASLNIIVKNWLAHRFFLFHQGHPHHRSSTSCGPVFSCDICGLVILTKTMLVDRLRNCQLTSQWKCLMAVMKLMPCNNLNLSSYQLDFPVKLSVDSLNILFTSFWIHFWEFAPIPQTWPNFIQM